MSAANNLNLFNIYTAQYGREMWQSDGTEHGTVLVEDEVPDGSLTVFETKVIGIRCILLVKKIPQTLESPGIPCTKRADARLEL